MFEQYSTSLKLTSHFPVSIVLYKNVKKCSKPSYNFTCPCALTGHFSGKSCLTWQHHTVAAHLSCVPDCDHGQDHNQTMPNAGINS